MPGTTPDPELNSNPAHTDKDELINELSELIAVAKSLVF